MAGQPTTQLQVSEHRFVTRRIERALLCADVQPAHDPLRARSSLAVGCLLAAIAVAGCTLLAFVRPQPALGDAPIVMGRQSGALYVRVDQTLHPVLNLASARLIAATDADPRPVSESDIARAERGPLLGIPGAPQLIGTATSDAGTWSVCDTAGEAAPTTTVIAGDGQMETGNRIDPEQAVPVTAGVEADSGARTYLLYRGRRMLVDPAGLAPRRVSGLLLNAIPEAPPATRFSGRVAVLPAGSKTLCVNWARLSDDSADITLSAGAGLPLPAGQVAVTLAQADGEGPALDAVYMPPGRSAYVRSAGVFGQPGGARYLVADTGVRFELGDDDAARSLGLPATPAPAPWPVLAGLPAGPRLSRQPALAARDVLATP
ncbi:MAG TPA: type VII secretion protein EccB [Mycobacterium sp.]|nr:type VII secretion protein EccB [Mycobacterium sp.]